MNRDLCERIHVSFCLEQFCISVSDIDTRGKREHSISFRYAKTHGKYTEEELDVKLTHVEPKDWLDRAAFSSVKAVRFLFDIGEQTNRPCYKLSRIRLILPWLVGFVSPHAHVC